MQFFKSCLKCIKRELKLSNFGFEHKDVEQFYKSKWQRGDRSTAYLIYRWIWALFFTAVFIACLVLQFSDGKLFIFLTNWGIMLCVLTNLLGAYLVTRWYWYREEPFQTVIATECASKKGSGPTTIVKLYWLLHGVTISLAVVITTVYWTFLHGKMNKPMRFPVMSFITHCMNTVFMLVDLAVVAHPVRLLHTVYSMMLPIIYCLFTVAYFFCGGVDEYGNGYVYPILDWTNPVRGLITFVGVFGLYLIYGFLFFAFYKLKCLIHRSLHIVWSPTAAGII